MCKFVGTWGPLWCYSTLGFENLNGHLRRHCHGTCNVLPQLVHTIHKQQMLSLVQNRLMESDNPPTVAYLKIMLALRRLKQIWRSLQWVKKFLNERVQKALVDAGLAEVPVLLLPAFTHLHHNFVQYSCQVKAEAAQNSGVCAFEHNPGMQFLVSHYILLCTCKDSLLQFLMLLNIIVKAGVINDVTWTLDILYTYYTNLVVLIHDWSRSQIGNVFCVTV